MCTLYYTRHAHATRTAAVRAQPVELESARGHSVTHDATVGRTAHGAPAARRSDQNLSWPVTIDVSEPAHVRAQSQRCDNVWWHTSRSQLRGAHRDEVGQRAGGRHPGPETTRVWGTC